MGKLAGKVVVITGANSGIGLASAIRFAAEGARVFLAGRRAHALEQAVIQVGHNAVGIPCDVSDSQDLETLFDRVQREAGQIDVLFANAGGGDFATLEDVTDAHYARIFDTNVKGTLFTVQKALPLLKDGASIILTGSTSATTGVPAFSVYSASKAAIRSFARSWIMELAPRKIRVNVLVPGATSTPGWHGLSPDSSANQEMIRAVEATTPLGRLADPAEVAAAALFLASDDSRYVNGSELFVDGGAAQI